MCEIMENIRRLPLNALKFFYFVGKYGSLVAASQQLHVTHGAVSKQLKLLEEHLNETLFVKQGRNLRLSSAGLILYESCQYIFSELQSTLTKLDHGKDKDLVVSCEPTLAMRWLIPRITRFPKEFGFNVVILAAGGKVDFHHQKIDVAIRRNDFSWTKTIYSEFLCNERMGPVHIPSLATDAKKLHTYTRPHAWKDWEKCHGNKFLCKENMFFEHFYLSIQAAIAGLGTAMASELMVEDEIKQGILIAPYDFKEDGSGYYLLSEIAFETDYRRIKFLSWLREQMNDFIWE